MAVEDLIIPKYYENKLDIISTEIAIKYVKDLFERRLAHHLNLMRISAPLDVSISIGVYDDLNGTVYSGGCVFHHCTGAGGPLS